MIPLSNEKQTGSSTSIQAEIPWTMSDTTKATQSPNLSLCLEPLSLITALNTSLKSEVRNSYASEGLGLNQLECWQRGGAREDEEKRGETRPLQAAVCCCFQSLV